MSDLKNESSSQPQDGPGQQDFYRSALLIDGVDGELDSPDTTVRLSIPQWRTDEVVTVPIDQIPEAFRLQLRPGGALLAKVNLKAANSSDLQFKDFEIAPAVDPFDSF